MSAETLVELTRMPGEFAVCRLPPRAPLPDWVPAADGALVSITRTGDELSIVADDSLVPRGGRVERGWRGLAVRGPLPFDAVGILAGLATVLAEAGVSVFVISTYDTDLLLVKRQQLANALEALRRAGYLIGE